MGLKDIGSKPESPPVSRIYSGFSQIYLELSFDEEIIPLSNTPTKGLTFFKNKKILEFAAGTGIRKDEQ